MTSSYPTLLFETQAAPIWALILVLFSAFFATMMDEELDSKLQAYRENMRAEVEQADIEIKGSVEE